MTRTRDVVVCGPPRSGTSLLAQVVARAGLTQLDQLIDASPANPHGFCEDIRVNRLNDEILDRLPMVTGRRRLPRRLGWLGAFEPAPAGSARTLLDRMRRLTPETPYVIKDPRFSFTFPAWTPLLEDAVVVVAVRPAPQIATSLSRMIERDPRYFAGFGPNDQAIGEVVGALWSAAYRAILSWATPSTYLVETGSLDPAVLCGLGRVINSTLSGEAVDPLLGASAPMHGVTVDAAVGRMVGRRVALDRRRLVAEVGAGNEDVDGRKHAS